MTTQVKFFKCMEKADTTDCNFTAWIMHSTENERYLCLIVDEDTDKYVAFGYVMREPLLEFYYRVKVPYEMHIFENPLCLPLGKKIGLQK